MSRDMHLTGSEISVLKVLGLSGAQTYGKILMERADSMGGAEMVDTLDGLITMGYVLSNKVNIRRVEEVESASFRVNPSYAHELKDAMSPGRKREQENVRRKRRT